MQSRAEQALIHTQQYFSEHASPIDGSNFVFRSVVPNELFLDTLVKCSLSAQDEPGVLTDTWQYVYGLFQVFQRANSTHVALYAYFEPGKTQTLLMMQADRAINEDQIPTNTDGLIAFGGNAVFCAFENRNVYMETNLLGYPEFISPDIMPEEWSFQNFMTTWLEKLDNEQRIHVADILLTAFSWTEQRVRMNL